ncbi:hybrid sensor histidine kinase/response regulator [Chitinimonas naiadis]
MIQAISTLLVVDSDPVLAAALAEELQRNGFTQVLLAQDKDSALQLLHQQPVQLVLSELRLPGTSGLSLLETMRTEEALAEIPFVLMSGGLDRQSAEQAIRLGIGDLLVKPFTTQRLLERVQRVLHRDGPPTQGGKEDKEERASILVVDDTPDNLQLLAGLFRDQFKVKLAHNGEKAIAICHSNAPPDLILLDVMMPGMDGFEVARRLRQHHASEHIPIIFVTALSDERSREQGLALGAVDYVFKPIDPSLLRIRVRNLMRYVEHRRQLQTDLDQMLELAALRTDMQRLIGHDLLRPLNQSWPALQSLASDPGLSPAQRQQAELAAAGAKQMLEIIELASSQLELEAGQRKLKLEAVPLVPLLQDLITLFTTRYADKALRLELDASSTSLLAAKADPGLCHALFYRLLNHACDISPAGSQLQLTLGDSHPLAVQLELPALPGSSKSFAAVQALARAQGGSLLQDDADVDQRHRIQISLPRA